MQAMIQGTTNFEVSMDPRLCVDDFYFIYFYLFFFFFHITCNFICIYLVICFHFVYLYRCQCHELPCTDCPLPD